MASEWNKKTRQWDNTNDQKKLFSEGNIKKHKKKRSTEGNGERKKEKQRVQRLFKGIGDKYGKV